MNQRTSTIMLLLTAILLPLDFCTADDSPAKDSVQASEAKETAAPEPISNVVKINLRPAAEPQPVLKYVLLPMLPDRTNGNAAMQYHRAALTSEGKALDEIQSKLAEWLARPASELPRDEVRQMLAKYQHVLSDLHMAARREECDWELPLRERNLITLMLPEVQRTRDFGRLVALQARLQVADGEFDEAVTTLQTGFSMGQHITQGPTLINGLVGLAISRQMMDSVLQMAQQPRSPNMYWALATLPKPLVDIRRAIDTEMWFAYLSLPELQNLETVESPEQWETLFRNLSKSLGEIGVLEGELKDKAGLEAALKRGYPKAKERLIAGGRDAKDVEAMSVYQVVVLDMLQTYDTVRDQTLRWVYLPFWQARPYLDDAERYLLEVREQEIVPMTSSILPAVRAAFYAYARTDRDLAALQVVEALRLYAAAHDGKLPEKLSDVSQVPIPKDPTTGRDFEYSLQDGVATLKSARPEHPLDNEVDLHYEIRLQP